MNSLSEEKKMRLVQWLLHSVCAFQQIPAEAAQQEVLDSYFMMVSTQC